MKKHLGLGVIAVMSAKGTATLAATMFLPTWELRLIALGVLVAIIIVSVVMHRRRRKQAASAE